MTDSRKIPSKVFAQEAINYHAFPTPGKLRIEPTKVMETREDLALAYSPGVAIPCEEIVRDPLQASFLTTKGNLVAVISNGTAVLGLGNIGPLAAKPVMEGKAVLFKKFAGIDVFDLEIQESDPHKLIEIIASLEPTFGGINLEDIKAPECFEVESELRKRLKIPVFHDDQHGTAIIVTAAVLNGLELVGKSLSQIKCVVSGAGAAALACLELLCAFGLKKENIYVTDTKGVLYTGRPDLVGSHKAVYAQETDARLLSDLMENADLFLGLSVAGALKPEMLSSMAPNPLVLALANPVPEIMPEEAEAVRSDVLIATGRSDYPNQVNNVLCFPYIFRGALDVGATTINQEMKMACVRAIAALARQEPSDVVSAAYGGEDQYFGPKNLLPKPFDPRLILEIAPAVAMAAMETGVATRPLPNLDFYKQKLMEHVFRSGAVMRPLFLSAQEKPQRVVFSEGEERRVLQAVQSIVRDRLAIPTLVGRRDVISERIKQLGLSLQMDKDFVLVDPNYDERYYDYWTTYHRFMERKGVSPETARKELRSNHTVIAALLALKGEVDAVVAGPVFRYRRHVQFFLDLLGLESGKTTVAALNGIVLNRGIFFFCDAYVNEDPNAVEIAEIASMAADAVSRFGLVPKVAFVSHSNFGSMDAPSSRKMRDALQFFSQKRPDLEAEGEMQADTALDAKLRSQIFPRSRFEGAANLLIFPNLESANIAFNITKGTTHGQPLGPLLLGLRKAAHILTPSTTVRGILNMTALAVVDAQEKMNRLEEV